MPARGWLDRGARSREARHSARGSTHPRPCRVSGFLSGGRPQHVWFWHLFDGRPTTFADPYNLVELFGLAWRYGFRRDGDQLFVRVSSNRPWAEFTAEPFLAETFSRLQPLGL